jgi:CO/xanthine dehydrogenase FAD-binding subunit
MSLVADSVRAAEYLRPASLTEALDFLRAARCTVLAGCTDLYPASVGRALDGRFLDLADLAELRGITEGDDHIRIGALTTWTGIVGATLPPGLRALQIAARQIGGVQIQHAGTLGGNLCNASPAADGVPALMIVDAEVELASADARRRLPLGRFILGNRRTARRPDELLTAVIVPKRNRPHASTFLKLGTRAYQVISIAMVAVLLERDAAGRVAAAAVAVGSCAPVARRLPALEAGLVGRPLGGGRLAEALTDAPLAPLAPITDVRGTAEYRSDAARTLIGRALDAVQRDLA